MLKNFSDRFHTQDARWFQSTGARRPRLAIPIVALFIACIWTGGLFAEKNSPAQPVGKPGVAVAPFAGDDRGESAGDADTNEKSKKSEMNSGVGETLAAQILARLQRANGLTLIERGQLKKVLAELALNQSGAVDESNAPQMGRLLGAEYIILGRISLEGESEAAATQDRDRRAAKSKRDYTASLRVVRAETGVVIGAAHATGDMRRIADSLAAEALKTLRIYLALENPESPYSVLLKLKGGKSKHKDGKNPVYRLGDELNLEFKVLRHADRAPKYVYIQLYSIDAKGALTMIYPNKFSPQARIEVDRTYKLPADRDDFEWVMAPPVGHEKIQAIVTTEAIDFFQIGERYKTEAFPTADMRRFRDDLRTFGGIVTRIKKEKLKDWSAERVSYELVEP
ncbi:MAG: DUF4384 domain-containing protein [bacterium]|nr:DUF4384 domain-containing protein [bacterium]